ncbi:oxidoreductase [Thelonectria olida]|uniref:Oxidoreductase n=1 Tax=Thelonectria olida TaxID=1576542 RepID=A0A9P8VX70_9HYPO|nr:oxidoreductase [Thelonectria olida]
MAQKRVLIAGGGIAGPVLAYWLGKSGYKVVVLERLQEHQRQAGQVIDIEGPSKEIVSRMGILDEIQQGSTKEAGVSFVDESGRALGMFPAGQSAGATKLIEIMRPVLGKILFDAADAFENVEFRFGCTVASSEQSENAVQVEYSTIRGTKTRDLILPGTNSQSCIKSLNVFVAFFSIPTQPQDGPCSRLYTMTGRKSALIKPMTEEESSAYFIHAKYDQELHEARESRDIEKQKEVLARRYRGCGWETDRIVQGMLETDNFYFEEISQVKLDKWSHGRCVLLGDAAWCPSPLTGQGTNVAILGAYVLASKLVEHGDDLECALGEYERDMRPFVSTIQSIPLGGYAPLIGNPDSSWGVWLFRSVVSWVS